MPTHDEDTTRSAPPAAPTAVEISRMRYSLQEHSAYLLRVVLDLNRLDQRLLDWEQALLDHRSPAKTHITLTERERTVLQLAAEGHTNAAIAQQLAVSQATVKGYMNNIHRKLATHHRTEAIQRARLLGLL